MPNTLHHIRCRCSRCATRAIHVPPRNGDSTSDVSWYDALIPNPLPANIPCIAFRAVVSSSDTRHLPQPHLPIAGTDFRPTSRGVMHRTGYSSVKNPFLRIPDAVIDVADIDLQPTVSEPPTPSNEGIPFPSVLLSCDTG